MVDDSSTDGTLAIARQFESDQLRVVTHKNQGASATRNKAYSLCQGDYIQFLDADDLLAPDKIATQMEALGAVAQPKNAVVGQLGKIHVPLLPDRVHPKFIVVRPFSGGMAGPQTAIQPVQQTASWLVSRELAEMAGPWDIRLLGDDDGEYFCRVLLASEGVRFVPQSKVDYRSAGTSSLSYIGNSEKKMVAQLCSMDLHIRYIRSLEDSPRVREACVTYLQNWLGFFYPRSWSCKTARRNGGDPWRKVEPPPLSWKYSWIEKFFGRQQAKRAQVVLPRFKWELIRRWDKTMFQIEGRKFEESFQTS